jgi:hypothetical protein
MEPVATSPRLAASRKGDAMHHVRRPFAVLVLTVALVVSFAGAATAAPTVEEPGSLVVRVLDWLAQLQGWTGIVSPDAAPPAADPAPDDASTPALLPGSDSQTGTPVDDGTEAGPYVDPNG